MVTRLGGYWRNRPEQSVHQGWYPELNHLVVATLLTQLKSTGPLLNCTRTYIPLNVPQSPRWTSNPLDSLNYPQIDETISRELWNLIYALKIQDAIKSVQNGRSPGPDGFTVEFYKAFSASLVPILVRTFNNSYWVGQLPATVASIFLLLKKDKDPTLCSSYRPIPLLNVDCKILAKVLALCFQRVMSSIISLDQTGFTSGRQSFFNTRRLFDIMFSPTCNTPEVVVALDAEKAFDGVEWGYLFFIWEKCGFYSKFIS